MRSFIVLGILLLMLPVASGFEDFLEVVVEIDASGNAFVSYFPSIDSRLRTELNMSVPGGSYFKVYDENSSLSFTSEDDWLVVSPSKHVESYLFVVEFFTSELTEKKEDFWFARFSYFDGFENKVVRMKLPPNSKVFEVSDEGILSGDGDSIVAEWVLTENQDAVFVNYSIPVAATYASYKLEEEETLWWYVVLVGVVLFCATGVFWYLKKKESPLETDILNGLPARQKEIVQILKKNNDRVTQNLLLEKMSLPKSSLSRNVKALERKGIVEVVNLGNSNLISLKKE